MAEISVHCHTLGEITEKLTKVTEWSCKDKSIPITDSSGEVATIEEEV